MNEKLTKITRYFKFTKEGREHTRYMGLPEHIFDTDPLCEIDSIFRRKDLGRTIVDTKQVNDIIVLWDINFKVKSLPGVRLEITIDEGSLEDLVEFYPDTEMTKILYE